MSTDGEDVGVRTPTWLNGFVAATAVGLVVASAFWLAAVHRYGSSGGYDDLSANLDSWLWPVGAFLAVIAVTGLVFLTLRGRRRFGVGLLSGAVVCAVLDLTWVVGYLVFVRGS